MSAKREPEPHSSMLGEVSDVGCAGEQAALEHAAYVAAKFVIARWQDGSRRQCANLNLPHNQSARARWYAQAQQGLQEWIARGGFSLPVDAHDAAALAGSAASRPTLYRVPSNKTRRDRSCVG